MKMFAALTLTVAVLAACGNDSETDAQPYVDALSDQLATIQDFQLEDDDADCLAADMVDLIGAENLEDAGISPEDLARSGDLSSLDVELPDDTEERLTSAFDECVDLGELVADQLALQYGIPSGTLDCIAEENDDKQLASLLAPLLLDADADATEQGEEFGNELLLGLSADCSQTIFLESGVAAGEIDEEQRACLEEDLEPGLAKQILAEGNDPQGGDPEVLEAAQSALQACGVSL